MISYDILQRLEVHCFELLTSTTGMTELNNARTTGNSHNKILGALRKIIIANEMMGKGIICISGLQGAGKTSLMKNFYGISEEYFNIALGVGEKIPVLISENKDCENPEPYAVCLNKDSNGNYFRDYVRMNPETFRNASTSKENEQDIMYLELRVPYKHLNNESYAFMLLPGFEKKNDYWKSLIDFSVKCSDASIFVFNESSFSKYDNQVLLEKIHTKFGNSLIYAISQSDMSGDDNATVKNTCIEVMKIEKHEEDRVVCVGEYADQSKNEKWINELKYSIEKYCNSIEIARKNCNEYIYEVIEDEIRPVLIEIKESLGTDSGEEIKIHLENSSYLKAFDQVVKDRRRKLDRNLEAASKEASNLSRKKLEDIFVDKSYAKSLGVKDNRILARTIFGENTKDIKRARERIEVALKGDDGLFYFQHKYFDAISQLSTELYQDNYCKTILVEENRNAISVFDEEEKNVQSLELIKKRENVLHDAANLLLKSNSIIEMKHNNPADTMKIIAELGSAYFGLTFLNESVKENGKLIMPEIVNSKLELDFDKMSKDIKNVDKVILGTLGITGIDIMADGVMNAIPAIANAIGVSVPVVAIVAAVVEVAVIAVSITKDINRVKRLEYKASEVAIESVHLQMKARFLDAYDEAMETIRDCIEDNLITYSGYNKSIFKKTKAMFALNKIDEDLDFVCKEVMRNAYDVGAVFKG